MQWIPYEAAAALFKAAGYVPSPEQERVHRALFTDTEAKPRLVIVGGGIQSGKSYLAGHHVLSRWVADEITWLVGNRYLDVKREYGYVRDNAVRLGFADQKHCSYSDEGPWSIEFRNGHTVKTLSSDDATRLASEAPDGIVMCEPGRQDREAFETCWERVVPKAGWLLLNGTFERAAGWYTALWRECQGPNEYDGVALSLPAYSNRTFYPGGERDPRFQEEERRAKADPAGWDRFQERFLGIPRVPHDLVFYEFTRAVHVHAERAEYVPGVPVYLAVDPGIQFASVVLFLQVIQGQVHCFDEIYVAQVLNRDIITMVEQHRAFGDVVKVVLDPYGGTQRAMGQESVWDTWRDRLGWRGITVTRPEGRPRIMDRIGRVHDFLHRNERIQAPGILFAPRCRYTILEMEGWVDDAGHERGYRYQVQEDGMITSETPMAKDDHAMSALGYFLLEHTGYHDRDQLTGWGGRRPPVVVQTPDWLLSYPRLNQFAMASARRGAGRRR